ncbi:MAG: polysaccharide export protein [Candidatus Omnitrophica bacterium]|jgi:polysaccharide export outer membrane protein|nr:polysaccharide export protein [Candidatus Omnitrophota bacterium]
MKLAAFIVVFFMLFSFQAVMAQDPADRPESQGEYRVGVGDILEISVLQPEPIMNLSPVASDGTITFPYIGSVSVKGMLLGDVQNDIQARLADGYMKYPVVSVTLKESRSRKFFVYGEVMRPGTFPLEDNTTVLKAISIAGGMTKFGSASRVKILRPYKDKPGYESIKVNMGAAMKGSADSDVVIQPEDIVVVTEGLF